MQGKFVLHEIQKITWDHRETLFPLKMAVYNCVELCVNDQNMMVLVHLQNTIQIFWVFFANTQIENVKCRFKITK